MSLDYSTVFAFSNFLLPDPTVFAGSQTPPDYVLSVHSSKALIVEPVKGPNYMLADAVIQLAVAKGDRHEVRIDGLNLFIQMSQPLTAPVIYRNVLFIWIVCVYDVAN